MPVLLGTGSGEFDAVDSRFADCFPSGKIEVWPFAQPQQNWNGAVTWVANRLARVGNYEVQICDADQDTKHADSIVLCGGNTFELLSHIQKNNLANRVRNAIATGMPIYGVSAGAIALGRDISSASIMDPPIEMDTQGIGVFGNLSFLCHYEDSLKDELGKFVKPIIGIADGSGLMYADGEFEVIGDGNVLIDDNGDSPLADGEKFEGVY